MMLVLFGLVMVVFVGGVVCVLFVYVFSVVKVVSSVIWWCDLIGGRCRG